MFRLQSSAIKITRVCSNVATSRRLFHVTAPTASSCAAYEQPYYQIEDDVPPPIASPTVASTSVTAKSFQYIIDQNDALRCNMAYSLSFSADDTPFDNISGEMDLIMTEQLRNSKEAAAAMNEQNNAVAATTSVDQKPLPRTLKEALLANKSRAIVVTECQAPFRVVDVNTCWENLCGYSFYESKGKTLGELLKGAETDPFAATAMTLHAVHGDEAGAVLTNYTKSGRKFRNRVRVGPIYDETQTLTHLVGVLQEVREPMSM